MGQYHSVYNLDKREAIYPHSMGQGTKLLEFCPGGPTICGLGILLANSNGRGGGDLNNRVKYERKYVKKKNGSYGYKPLTGKKQALSNKIDAAIKAVAGRWAGDRIVIQGDYAEAQDPGFIDDKDRESFKDISPLVIKALATDEYLRDEFFAGNGYLMQTYVAPVLKEIEE